MFKKIFCLALAVVMIMSVAAVGFSAAQVEIADVAADADAAVTGADADVATTGAEADAAATGAGDVIKYDNSVTKWAGPVQFFIYDPETGDQLIAWGSKKLNGEDEGNNIWSKDVSGYGMESGKQYAIIFADSVSGDQTYDLMMDSSCIGDTGKATGNSLENPVDSTKTAKEAVWSSSSLGPRKQVTSIGNVVGQTTPSFTSDYKMFVDFLTNTLDNARQYADKDDQTLLDDTAKALSLSKDDVEKAIKESGKTVKWTADASSLSGGSSDSGNNDTTTTSNNNTTTTSTTKTGSASDTKTGQTENVLFIMLGVMVVAAGVIFFARKRDRA